jgi:hypothetical protein
LEKLSSILDILESLPKDCIKLEPYYHFGDCLCCEQLWNLCLIKKYVTDIKFCDTTEINHNHWDYVLNNFLIGNTSSHLGALNKTWITQPEDMNFYITTDKYLYHYNNQKHDTNI